MTARRNLPTPAADLDDPGCGQAVLDALGRIAECDGALFSPTAGDLRGQPFRRLLAATHQPAWDEAWAALNAGGPSRTLSLVLAGAVGPDRCVQAALAALPKVDGRFAGAQVLLLDVSMQERAERIARRTFRALRVLGTLNAELVRADEEAAFLNAVCRMIVERGGYRLAAVGFAEHDPKRRVRVVAHASAVPGDDYLDRVEISWGDTLHGQGPTGRAIRSGQPQVNRDFLIDPLMAPWRDAARTFGYQSSIALPLKTGRMVIGALSIYAPEPDAFDDDEVRLLIELANDLSFGLDTLRARVEHRRADAMVAQLAYHDPLTGLANRTRLLNRLREALTGASAESPVLLVTVTIERFDDILAGIGMRPADQLLAQVADRLVQAFGRREDTARIGSKSFAMLLPGRHRADAIELAQLIRNAMRPAFHLAGLPIGIDIVIGAALAPEHALDADTLLLRATLAARDAPIGDEPCRFYRGSALEDRRGLTVLGELRTALEQGQLSLAYQPKLRVRDGAITGCEALLRWTHPQHGPISPGAFMPIAEQSGLIGPLTDHVIEDVLRQQQAWAADGFRLPVAVNVSARNLADPGFSDRVLAALAKHGVDPALLQLELTESALMAEPAHGREQLLRLQDAGVTTAIDDFGTGYSSLSYLAELPVRAVKIDRSFVVGMLGSARVRDIVAATISMAEALALDTIAEGVESDAQAAALIALGCRELQGFRYCMPVPADAFRAWAAGYEPSAWGFPPRRPSRE